MAMMSCCPRKVLRPQRADMEFDLERNTPVRVNTTVEGSYEGMVVQNPSKCGIPTYLELVNVVKVIKEPGQEEKFLPVEFWRVHSSEVISVERKTPLALPSPKLPTEKIFRSIVVETEKDFHSIMKMLTDVTEVALNFHGVFVGRDGTVGWITLFFGDTLVCIDAIELPSRMREFWDLLKEFLFGNPQILKVMYNSRPIADFLYHKKAMFLKNVDDLQVSEMTVWLLRTPREDQARSSDFRYKKLSEMVECFLSESILPEELQMLKDFEKEDFSVESPLMQRPIQENKYCKCVALDMKYLLEIRKKLEFLRCEHKNLCVAAQVEELINAGNEQMEYQNSDPLQPPMEVLRRLIKPRGQLIDLKSTPVTIPDGGTGSNNSTSSNRQVKNSLRMLGNANGPSKSFAASSSSKSK